MIRYVFVVIVILLFFDNSGISQEKDTSIGLQKDSMKTEILADTNNISLLEDDSTEIEILDEIVFTPISKKEIKNIVKKINNSIEDNYNKNDGIFINYNEKTVANDSIQNDLIGCFGVNVPSYSDINIEDIELAKIYSLEKENIVGKEEAINAVSSPFIVPTMGFVLPIISIEDSPFIDDISDYKYYGWSDDSTYIVHFEPEDYEDEYKFCGKIVINKEDFAVINLNYTLCSKNNTTKIKDIPYVLNKLSFKYKFIMRTALIFMWSARKFSNNFIGTTIYWDTDIGYKKVNDKYTLDYLKIRSSSKVTGNVDKGLVEKIPDKKIKKELIDKDKINVTQVYSLDAYTLESPPQERIDTTFISALFYDKYNIMETKKSAEKSDWRKGLYKKMSDLNKILQKNEK